MNLKEILIAEGKTRWLDIGNGGNFEDGFEYVDILPPSRKKKNYHRLDAVNSSDKKFSELGKYDLIRMQHFFEHLEMEEGLKLLKRLPKIMNKDCFLVITVPDLKVHVRRYLSNTYKKWMGFNWWAYKRISLGSPNSFYFSIFAHSMPREPHKWCYDFEGLNFLVKKSGKYKNIKELKVKNPLANIPFTHDRPEEDVCIIAQKK